MIDIDAPWIDKFRASQDAGFDGISLAKIEMSDAGEFIEAPDKTGLPIHNVNGHDMWGTRLSDADPAVRDQARANLAMSIRFAHDVGADSILLVLGKVTDEATENHDQLWERSVEAVDEVIPLAAELGVRILFENVQNGFCEEVETWVDYIDSFSSPWVGCFYDIGNLHRSGGSPSWLRALRHRAVKLDVKDNIAATSKNMNLFEGDVDWADIRLAVDEIGFTGWATAEVKSGGADRLAEVARKLRQALVTG